LPCRLSRPELPPQLVGDHRFVASPASRAEQLPEHDFRVARGERRVAGLVVVPRIVEEIGNIKRQMAMPIYEPKREDEVFANAMTSNAGPLSSEAVKRIFERIVDEAWRTGEPGLIFIDRVNEATKEEAEVEGRVERREADHRLERGRGIAQQHGPQLPNGVGAMADPIFLGR
jgi:hypothetical protein